MRTQETFSLMKSAKDIAVAIVADGDRIGGSLNEQKPLPVVEGEPAFDYRKHMQSLRLQLEMAKDEAVEAEDEHSARLIRLSREQDNRDEIAQASYDQAVIARQGLETMYQDGGFELAYFSGKTPRTPEKVLEQLVQNHKHLKQPAVELREVKNDAFSVDLGRMAENLEPTIPDLRDAIGRVDLASKEAEGSLVVKREAIQKLRRTVVWVGRTVEGLFFLAGEDELAKRIRKSTRRPLRPSEQEPAEQEPAEASPSEASEAASAASTAD